MTIELRRQVMASFLILVLALGIVTSVPHRSDASAPAVVRFIAGLIVGVIVSWELEPLKVHYDNAREAIVDAWEASVEAKETMIELDRELNPRSPYVEHCYHARCGYY